MVRMYSKRLLSPYVGVIQVAEWGRARALSLYGDNWVIRYALAENELTRNTRLGDDPNLKFLPVATIEKGRVKPYPVHPLLDPDDVRAAIGELSETVTSASVPFAAADCYEYWLLDSRDHSPLALLHSSVDAQDMGQPPPNPEWLAMPAAQLAVPDPNPPEQIGYVPPVNYRFERLVEARAGAKPRAAWFERTDENADNFPPCLVREDWDEDEQRRVCGLYIHRLAPRLLMMAGLPQAVRHRLEQAACDYVFDVERFYPLYPEITDKSLLNAARVEARMRRANET